MAKSVGTIMASLFLLTATLLPAVELPAVDAKNLQDAQRAINAGRHGDALRLLLPLEKKYPDVGDIPRLLTHTYHGLGEFDKARQTALRAIGGGRLAPDVLARLAQIDQQRDDQVALINIVRLLTIMEADNRNWRMIYADLLAEANEFAESAAAYRELLEAEPQSATLHVRLGNVLMQQDRLEEAALSLETAWHLGSKQDELSTTLAELWKQIGDDAKACAWAERGLAAGEDLDEEHQLRVAQMFWSSDRFDRAATLATPLTKSQNAELRGQAHVLLGQVAMQHNQIDQAIGHWQQAVAAGVDSSSLLATLGGHYFNSQDFQQAAEMLRRVVDREQGKNEQHLRVLIVSLLRNGETVEARDYLRLYIEHHGLSDDAKSLVRLIARAQAATP